MLRIEFAEMPLQLEHLHQRKEFWIFWGFVQPVLTEKHDLFDHKHLFFFKLYFMSTDLDREMRVLSIFVLSSFTKLHRLKREAFATGKITHSG